MTDNFDKELGETLRRIREEKRISTCTELLEPLYTGAACY